MSTFTVHSLFTAETVNKKTDISMLTSIYHKRTIHC